MLPFLIFSDKDGNIYSHPHLRMLVAEWQDVRLPEENELKPKTDATALFMMPGRHPVGYNPDTEECEVLYEYEGMEVFAVSAFLPPSYLRLANPAYAMGENEVDLPLWAYTACGMYGGKFYVAAMRCDNRVRQLPNHYGSCDELKEIVAKRCADKGDNRLYKHFARCAVEWGCLAAKNLFYERWEAPLVVSGACNARCLGCLSEQDSGDCESPHERINFVPSPDEVADVALDHISRAKEPICSFGQGCEGEPILQGEIIAKSLKLIRQETKNGTLHLNTNASRPKMIEKIIDAGLDSMRVSMNSITKEYYLKYFNPVNYSFEDVCESIKIAKDKGIFVLINLFMYPGFSDRISEVERLIDFIEEYKIDMILLRNLNIDPEWYFKAMGESDEECIGLIEMIEMLQERFPNLHLGYFNVPVKNGKMTADYGLKKV